MKLSSHRGKFFGEVGDRRGDQPDDESNQERRDHDDQHGRDDAGNAARLERLGERRQHDADDEGGHDRQQHLPHEVQNRADGDEGERRLGPDGEEPQPVDGLGVLVDDHRRDGFLTCLSFAHLPSDRAPVRDKRGRGGIGSAFSCECESRREGGIRLEHRLLKVLLNSLSWAANLEALRGNESAAPMKSIAFFNNKGGVGKTTLLCNVAAFLAGELAKKVLIVDADPQCNATQLMLGEATVYDIYNNTDSFTIQSIIHPLSIGKGYSQTISTMTVSDYSVELLPGDPKLALKEDLLSKDWQDAIAGDIRGLRTSFLFYNLLERCKQYDYVLFDIGPSLGSINRAVLLACNFFVSPMSIDIFSLKAIENISSALLEWRRKLDHGMKQVDGSLVDDDIPVGEPFGIKFAGYVAQQYIQKTTSSGDQRAVDAYEKIMKRIPRTIKTNFVDKLQPNHSHIKYEIGTVPNLYSLIPMSQTAHKPVFDLKAKDGVRGAHFSRVRSAYDLISNVSNNLLANIKELAQ